MKFLIDAHHGLGDVIKLIPMIDNVRSFFPDAIIDVLILSDDRNELLRYSGIVNNTYIIDGQKSSFFHLLNTVLSIRKVFYDVGLIAPMAAGRKMYLFFKLCRCKHIIAPTKESRDSNELIQSLSLIEQLGLQPHYETPLLCKRNPGSIKKNRIGICMSGKNDKSNGRYSNDKRKVSDSVLIETANMLVSHGYEVILFGGPEEELCVKALSDDIDFRVENRINELSIPETIEYMNTCDLIISGECGMAHMADASGTQTLIYQTVSDMDVVGPFSTRVHRLTANLPCQYCLRTPEFEACKSEECVRYITAGRIVNEVKSIVG